MGPVNLQFFSDADAVAVDGLLEAGFVLQTYDLKEALRLWVLSIRGKVDGRWLGTSSGGSCAQWVIWRKGAHNLDAWVRSDRTEDLFAQIQLEIKGQGGAWFGGFAGNPVRTDLWSDIRPEDRALVLGGGRAWQAELGRIRASVAESTLEELNADPNGVPVGSWLERP